MNNYIDVRGIKIGEGIPKICVPIVGKTKEEILNDAAALNEVPHDVVEWRVDWFDDVFEYKKLVNVLENLREILGNTPLLFTFRTSNEGGEKDIDKNTYAELNKKAASTGLIDLVDVELFTGDEIVKDIVESAHKSGVKVIASNHDFNKTPAKDEIIRRLVKMQELGADIPKIAVMPTSKKDVAVLIAATAEMSEDLSDRPIITMSMAGTGLISRLSGEAFGSAMTFGSAGKASAPGQMNASDLRQALELYHQNQDFRQKA
ncbi:MAG: type I 3-dehydroquinate dehydratase [Lachnospiraceae bacterium]|nr:type I 3-dehydroquinate dehydratase [Lachnospiraceae bacterium]